MNQDMVTDIQIASAKSSKGDRSEQFALQKDAITVSDVRKVFKVGEQDVEVLKGVSLAINRGEFTILFGPSGCGKSTLLHLILGLEDPTAGEVDFMGVKLSGSNDPNFTSTFRKLNIGMVYQQSLWVKSLSVRENVALPLMLAGTNKNQALNRSIEMLRMVGMLDWADYFPTELSAGQQQRTAMARALVNDPEVIVADEPTGNLDFESGKDMMSLFYKLNHELGKTVILVTHDLEYLIYADKAFQMLDGQVIATHDKGAIEELLHHNIGLKKNGNNHEEA
ncbi:MAG: ABC transporter ATP-binding protein [Candidatus Dojkabacteria bacterium]|nr:MAG: ABC transporter ATP-binding protein [Candidatus Dojkabacteria bacterium]